MIAILYPIGTFGTTLEYCLKNFSRELTRVEAYVKDDGSMHSFSKEFHPITFQQYLDKKSETYEVISPTYPTQDYTKPLDSLIQWSNILPKQCHCIVVYFDSREQYERNVLFCYYKIPSFFDHVLKDKAQDWNHSYASHHDMQVWELREALSFYIDQYDNYADIGQHIPKNFMKITPDDVLLRLPNMLEQMLTFCNLTPSLDNLQDFYQGWKIKQQYILDEFDTVNKICTSIKNHNTMAWHKLSIIGEAIVQSRLRRQGTGLKCYNLVDFPTNTVELEKYFE